MIRLTEYFGLSHRGDLGERLLEGLSDRLYASPLLLRGFALIIFLRAQIISETEIVTDFVVGSRRHFGGTLSNGVSRSLLFRKATNLSPEFLGGCDFHLGWRGLLWGLVFLFVDVFEQFYGTRLNSHLSLQDFRRFSIDCFNGLRWLKRKWHHSLNVGKLMIYVELIRLGGMHALVIEPLVHRLHIRVYLTLVNIETF